MSTKALTTGIYSLFTAAPGGTHNSFYVAIGGRLYKDQAPQGTIFPYAVYFVILDAYDSTFTEDYEDVSIQFNLFSDDESSTEIENMYDYLKTLYDNCLLTVSGYRHLYMKRNQGIPLIDDDGIRQYSVDYSVLIQKN